MTTPSRENVWKMFDKISATYDLVNRAMTLGIDCYWRRKMNTFLPEGKGLKLLDCATGTGDQILSFLKKKDKIGEAIGIDLAAKMLEIGQKKLKNHSDKVRFVMASGEAIPYVDESFDCVSISFGIRNMVDPLLCLREMYRVLKKEGKVLVLEGSLPENKNVKKLHLFYLRKILPNIGSLISNNKDAYTYLNQTIETFPCGEDFCNLLKEAGFTSIKAHPLTLGAVTIYVAEKSA